MTIPASPDAWFLSADGVPHDPAGARMATFLSSGPKRGIVPAGPQASGAVRPMSTPSNKGLVLPFVGVAPNPAPGHFGEAYVFRSRTSKEFTLRAASSSGPRTDAIITRLWDEGMFPEHPMPGDEYVTVDVIEGVDAGIESADALAAAKGIDYPFVWHGNVTLPASENVVTAARITDKRYQIGGEVSHAERIRVGDLGAQWLNSTDRTNGAIFPNTGGQHVLYIPEWAGQMKVTFKWLDLEYVGTANSFGNRFVRIGSGAAAIDTHKYHFDAPQGSLRQTAHWEIVDVLSIPEAMRGTSQRFEARAFLGQGANTEQVRTRNVSATTLEVEFRETLN